MPKQTPKDSDNELLERLNRHPALKHRLGAILELAENEGSVLRTADEVEALLIEEVRRLGAETMSDWARGAHAQVAAEMKAKDPSSYCGKKKR